jgi:LuxR family maltose regulon positive regulatory protein
MLRHRGSEAPLIVHAKVVVPQVNRTIVRRTRVAWALDAGLAARLTVVQAAAGYGKTTAVASWLAASERPGAWVSVDRHDNDPRRLVAHLLAALREALPARTLSAAEQALEGGSDLSLTVIPLIADALDRAAPTGLTVVFDDYHLIGDETARSVVRDLLDIAPPGVHVVITSRTRPAVNLARRLAAGEATVIDARQLAFLPDEAARLLNDVHHLSLTGADVREAVRRVHGWAAGLQLLAAALKLRGEGDQSSLIETLGAMTRGELVDYVTEELLADTSPAQCRFLLHTAVLPRINGALAAAVTEDPDARELLEELREQRQFVSAEPVPGGWLRVHELIRLALLASLERREPGTTTRLHARAAAWFEQHGMIAEAIEQTTAADDLQALARLTRTHGFSLVMARETSVLHAALDALRAANALQDPFLEALDLFVQWQQGVHPRLLAPAAWQLHDRCADRPDAHALISLLVATPVVGEIKRSIAAGLAAHARYADAPQFADRIAQSVGFALLWEGRVAEARALAEPLTSTGTTKGQIIAETIVAGTHILEKDAVAAERHARRAVQQLERSGFETSAEFSSFRGVLANALRLAGKLEEAREQLEISLALERRRPGSLPLARLLLTDARLALAERDRARARTSLRAAQAIFDTYPDVGTYVRAEIADTEAELATRIDAAGLGSAPTEAELRVLAELAQTTSRAQIAARLYLSEATIKSHLRRLYRRLGASNRTDALAAARERGLLPATAGGEPQAARAGR